MCPPLAGTAVGASGHAQLPQVLFQDSVRREMLLADVLVRLSKSRQLLMVLLQVCVVALPCEVVLLLPTQQ